MQLVPKVAKLEDTIRALEEKLKAKDQLISGMKKDYERELKDRGCKLFSDSHHLTNVSKFYGILYYLYFLYLHRFSIKIVLGTSINY